MSVLEIWGAEYQEQVYFTFGCLLGLGMDPSGCFVHNIEICYVIGPRPPSILFLDSFKVEVHPWHTKNFCESLCLSKNVVAL